MASTGKSYEGSAVNVGSQVSVMGTVFSTSGSGASTQQVLVQEQFGVYKFTAQGADCTTLQPSNVVSPRLAMDNHGKLFGVVGDRLTANGTVVAVSGAGQSASLTVKLISGTPVIVSAGSCHSSGA